MKKINSSVGLMFGVILGLVYCILLFWRWSQASNLLMFGALSLLNYLIILGLLFYVCVYRKKQTEGFAGFKDLFQTLMITVIIFELIYAIYNFVHLKYIDPNVIDKMKAGMLALLEKAGTQISDADKSEKIAQLDKLKDATNFGKIIQNFFTSLAISGVFAILIALIMRKEKPVFQEVNN